MNGGFERNIYPNIHICYASINFLTNLSLIQIGNIYEIIIRSFYALGIYLCLKQIINNNKYLLFGLILGILPIYGWTISYTHPNLESLYLFPLLIFCFYKTISEYKDINYQLITLLLGFAFVIYHPTAAIFLVIYIATIYFAGFVNHFKLIDIIQNIQSNIKVSINIAQIRMNPIFGILLLIAISYWIMNTYLFNMSIDAGNNIINLALGDSSNLYVTRSISNAAESTIKINDLLIFIWARYGIYLLLILISTISYLLILSDTIKLNLNKKSIQFRCNNKMSLLIILYYALAFVFTLLIFITNIEENYERLMRFLVLLSPIIIPVGLWTFLSKLKQIGKSDKYTSLIIVSLIIFSSIATISYFPKNTFSPISQVKESDIVPIKWLEHAEGSNIVYSTYINVHGMTYYFYPRSNVPYYNSKFIPNNYDFNTEISTTTINVENQYLITGLRDVSYKDLYPEYLHNKITHYYSELSYNKLKYIEVINKIYCGKYTNIYKLNLNN